MDYSDTCPKVQFYQQRREFRRALSGVRLIYKLKNY